MGRTPDKLLGFLKKYWLAFAAGLAFAIVSFLVINVAMKPLSSSKFCGTTCHEMEEAYRSWELSAHYANDSGNRIECIDCHLPPKDKYFTHLIAKGYEGAKDGYMHFFGAEYDGEKTRARVLEKLPNSRCIRCHSNLLVKPSSPAAMMAHKAMLNPAEGEQLRCLECHESLHEREKKIFSSE